MTTKVPLDAALVLALGLTIASLAGAEAPVERSIAGPDNEQGLPRRSPDGGGQQDGPGAMPRTGPGGMQGMGPGGGMRRPPGPPPLHEVISRHAEELGIEPEVLERIGAIAQSAREEMMDAHEASHAAREAIMEIAQSPESSPEQIQQAAAAVGEAEAHLAQLRASTARAMLSLLTEDQRAALQQLAPPRHDGPQGMGGGPQGMEGQQRTRSGGPGCQPPGGDSGGGSGMQQGGARGGRGGGMQQRGGGPMGR